MRDAYAIAGTGYFTRQQWFSLPLAFRRRWWKETEWGNVHPSVALLGEAMTLIDKPAPKCNAPVTEAKP